MGLLLVLEKANVVPIHKKMTVYKELQTSFISPDMRKSPRKVVVQLFSFFTENDLISQSQSDFKPDDACIKQLLSMTHEIYKSFDDGWEVRGVFLAISKAFDEV